MALGQAVDAICVLRLPTLSAHSPEEFYRMYDPGEFRYPSVLAMMADIEIPP